MNAAAPGRLRWRCRRGMKELDLVFSSFLEHVYPTADAGLRSAFEALLELPDAQLLELLLGKANMDDPQIAAVIGHLRASQN